MKLESQIFKIATLNNLFLDLRLVIKSHRIVIFYLNSTPNPIQINSKLQKVILNHHLTLKLANLKNPQNINKYQDLSTQRLIGYGINKYDSLVVAQLLSSLITNRPVTTDQLRKFGAYLYYLGCTNQPITKAIVTNSKAKIIRENWLRHGRLIDLKDFIKREPFNVASAKNGLAIRYRQPIDKIQKQKQLARYVIDQIHSLLTVYELAKRPNYQKAIQTRKELVNEINLIYPQNRITLSTPLTSIVKATLKSSNELPKEVNYGIPHLTRNFLDTTLHWAYLTDQHYHLNHKIINRFLPIYNFYKNLQGRDVHKFRLKGVNLNLPYINAAGRISSNWLKFGQHFTSTNVNLDKFRSDPKGQLFVRSRRSGNWLINRKYRTSTTPADYQINLRPIRSKLLIRLDLFNPKIDPSRRFTKTLIDLGTSKGTSPLIQDQFTSAQIIWQLILWRIGEKLTLSGATVRHTSINGFTLSGLSVRNQRAVLQKSLNFLLSPGPLKLIKSIHHPTDDQIKQKLLTMREQLKDPQNYIPALGSFQLIPKVNPWSHQALFIRNNHQIKNLGVVTRIFLTKSNSRPATIHVAKVTRAKWYRYNNDTNYHNYLINQVERYGTNGHVRSLRKVKSNQNIHFNPKALKDFNPKELHYLYHQLDLKAYVKLLKSIEP